MGGLHDGGMRDLVLGTMSGDHEVCCDAIVLQERVD